ncbi:MAG: MotA/TolQ/ExbB proton channel family protein [Hahellaceae bacterium]|nr:MotA/TolQ/ExbB proton channel family protein [Hahellaceae bacterium]
MYELVLAGGVIMIPILLCSVIALAIIFERLWTLRTSRIAPENIVNDMLLKLKKKELTSARLREIQNESPMGRILVAGLINAKHGREIMKESILEEASQVVHELERFLSGLGTIAAITPLLGLLGTVIGMIEVFAEIQVGGAGNNQALAGGISKALITTAVGLTVAIPALVAHRFFQRKVDDLVVEMEQQALKLVEVVHGDREVELGEVRPS